ncbi:MAG: hypothetical protein ACRC8S_06870 [Fimbriiglobus sp.]
MTGDPTFSYCYRATLIADGDFRGVKLMWHPPGYPLLLAGLSSVSFGLLSPYAWGIAVSLACYAGLTVIIDRLIAFRTTSAATRLVAAGVLSTHETLAIWAAAPLTEPPYLLLVYAAVLALDRERVSTARGCLAGLLLGAACTLRLEGLAPTVGLCFLLAIRRRPGPIAGLTVGWTIAAGWLLADPAYLAFCRAAQNTSFTIPLAHGLAGNFLRLIECVYYSATAWLPLVLLLPYWLFLAVGLLHPAQADGRGRLHLLLIGVILPCLAVVTASIMHKRTGSFLLPAAAVWIALGCEMFIQRLGGSSQTRRLVILSVLALMIADSSRSLYRLHRRPNTHDPVSYVAASVLRDAAAETGPVWAFGAEPEVYAFWGRAVFYPFRTREVEYMRAYLDHIGQPEQFVRTLRDRGFGYLVFTLRDSPADGSPSEPHVYDGMVGVSPLRADLVRIRDAAAVLNLSLVGTALADGGKTRVYVFRVGRS